MVTQLRDNKPRFEQLGARVVCIGMDDSQTAARFRSKHDLPFTLLADSRRESYKALDIERGSVRDLIGPRVWKGALRSFRSGNLQGKIKGNPYQLGGAAVVATGGEIVYLHRSKNAADNAPIEELIDALGRAT